MKESEEATFSTRGCLELSETQEYEKCSKKALWRQGAAAFAGSLLALSCGTMLAWTSPVLPVLMSGVVEPVLTAAQASWVGSLVNVGGFMGALLGGRLADTLGRKKLLLMCGIPLYVSWCLLLWARTAWAYYLGRVLAGCSIGIVSVATPTYIAEISQGSIRGSLGTFFQLQLCLGILLMYIIALVEDVFTMTWICSAIPLVFYCVFLGMPESPGWLLGQGRGQEALAALAWLGQSELPETRQDPADRACAALLRDPAATRALLLSLALMFFQQMSAVNAVVFYTTSIFEMSGTSMSSYAASLINAIVLVLATLVATVLVDRCGRRLLLLFSSGMVTFCLGSLGFYMYLTEERGVSLSGLSLLPVVSLCTFSFVFSMGLGPVPWIMMAELVRPEFRAATAAFSAAASWGLAFLVTRTFPDLTRLLGVGQTFGLFALCSFLGAVFILTLIPETKGKHIDIIIRKLAKKQTNGTQINLS